MYKQAPLEFRYSVNILILFGWGGGEGCEGKQSSKLPGFERSVFY